MKPNNLRRVGTAPPQSNPALAVDSRTKTNTESQQLLVPEPYQSIPAQDLLKENCGKSGWIRKEGGSIKTWHDRYVILHKGCVYYYCNSEASTTAGKFSLSGYRLSHAPEKSSRYQWTFKLVHLQPEKRKYYFAAYSEREMNEWMESISKEIEEYCGIGKLNIAEPSECGDSGPEYFYPEVQPKFDPEEMVALFGKPSPILPRRTTTPQPLYCPPPDIDPKDIVRKSPRLPRPVPPPQRVPEWPKGCSIQGSPHTLRPAAKLPPPGSSSVLPHKDKATTTLPPRLTKPEVGHAPLTPPKPKPKPLLRPPPLVKRFTEPILNYGSVSEGQDDDEISEGYLDIVPDTTPDDVFDTGKKPTLSRGYPDGNSVRHHSYENVLPNSAVRLDLDKLAVCNLLENKLGVYILRESQNAQSKRALAVWTGDRVRHYMIFYEEKIGYALDPEGARFKKLEDLLWYYYEVHLPKCDVTLTKPYKN